MQVSQGVGGHHADAAAAAAAVGGERRSGLGVQKEGGLSEKEGEGVWRGVRERNWDRRFGAREPASEPLLPPE